MIGSWEIEHLDNPALFHDLAVAYLDTCIVATRAMVYGPFFPRFSHSRVVLSMAYHATELFLKGAILRATGEKKVGGHVLKELYAKYEKIFMDEEFHFDVPFSSVYMGFTQEQRAELEKDEPPKDQMYRYHTDLEGEKWESDQGFTPESFLETLNALRKTFTTLGRRIHSLDA